MGRIGRPQERQISLTDSEREELERIARSRSASHGLVRRIKIILASAAGESNTSIARRLGIANPTICRWRNKWFAQGIAGLYGEARPGRPRTHDEEVVANLLRTVLKSKPTAGSHWTVRSAAHETGLSKSTVARMFALFGVQPHRSKSLQLSTDPLFVDKVRDIVGLYLNPPDKAVVLCVDEKSQVQALERTQPVLPLGLGYVEGVTHNYIRHGTTTLFAALDVANGRVLAQCRARHRHQEFLAFLKQAGAYDNVFATLGEETSRRGEESISPRPRIELLMFADTAMPKASSSSCKRRLFPRTNANAASLRIDRKSESRLSGRLLNRKSWKDWRGTKSTLTGNSNACSRC
jgi:putative transposase